MIVLDTFPSDMNLIIIVSILYTQLINFNIQKYTNSLLVITDNCTDALQCHVILWPYLKLSFACLISGLTLTGKNFLKSRKELVGNVTKPVCQLVMLS